MKRLKRRCKKLRRENEELNQMLQESILFGALLAEELGRATGVKPTDVISQYAPVARNTASSPMYKVPRTT